VVPPKGWKIDLHERRGAVDSTQIVPQGQSGKDWTDMLTVQFSAAIPIKAVTEVLNDQLERITRDCEDVLAGPANTGTETGFETGVRVIACTKSRRTGKGEVSLFKVLRGREKLYVVARSWRGAAFARDKMPLAQETTQEWTSFMQSVVLCDSRDPSKACPN